jgi:hypothetical protein
LLFLKVKFKSKVLTGFVEPQTKLLWTRQRQHLISSHGRVQPGACFHLFSQKQHALLDAQQPPEMLRVPLESLCLQVGAFAASGEPWSTRIVIKW